MERRTVRVLLVEDDPAAAKLTAEALRDGLVAHTIDTVIDGEEALNFLHRRDPYADAARPDLVLLDLNIPKIDGREVLARMKSDPALTDIPVVILTSSSNPADIQEAYRMHAACFITKPSELDEYFSSVRLLKELWFRVAELPKDKVAASQGSP